MILGPDEVRAIATGAVLVMLALAIREDALRQRVPNVLNACAFVLGIAMAFLAAGWSGVAISFGGALVGCAALVPFYLLRGMGAGDVKLMGAAGAYLEPNSALLAAAMAFVAGCVLALGVVLFQVKRTTARTATSPGARAGLAWRAAAAISVMRHERFPYAVAIGVGVVAALWLQGSLGALVAALGAG